MILRLHSSIMQNILMQFNEANGYFVWDEVPGWLRANGYNVRLKQDDIYFYGEFDTAEEATQFLLRFA